jgi:hypothetical protein
MIDTCEEKQSAPQEERELTPGQVSNLFKAIDVLRKKDLTGDGCVEKNPGPGHHRSMHCGA